MTSKSLFGFGIVLSACVAAAGCSGSADNGSSIGTTPSVHRAVATGALADPYATPTPPARRLYVDHAGVLDIYALPLAAVEKPLAKLAEDPGSTVVPHIAVDPYGYVAIATTSEVRLFSMPVSSFDPSKAKLILPFTPAITEVGPSGADIVDVEFDPNRNLWLLNNLGAEVSELRYPIHSSSVAALTIGFGAPGTKTAAFGTLVQARFDVSAALYVLATSATQGALFKTSFPYAKPPSSIGLALSQADFVDSSQYLPSNPNPATLILGQYFGSLSSPPPQQPPPPPVDQLSQFATPLDPVTGLFPDATVKRNVGALIADPPRNVFYTLDTFTGTLRQWALPLTDNAVPKLSIGCSAGANCQNKPEHLFLAP